MSDTGKLSANTADPPLKFGTIEIKKLFVSKELFDDKVPINQGSVALFLPLIVYRKNDGYEIIDGCKRYKALQNRGQKEVACGIVEPALDSAGAGLLRIGLNSCRHLHPREKLQFIGWLKSHFDEKIFHEQAEKLLGGDQNIHANECHEYEQLLACNQWLIDAVMRGTLDQTVAPEMNHLSETEAGALLNLFSTLSFSRQMQRELAEWLPEIAFIRKISLTDLLASLPFASILSDKKLNNPQKIAGIHDLAHDIRLPLYSQAKKALTQQARQINPDPSKVTLHASPYFEKDSLEIRIKAGQAEEIHRIIRQLASIDLVKWQELIDPTAHIVP